MSSKFWCKEDDGDSDDSNDSNDSNDNNCNQRDNDSCGGEDSDGDNEWNAWTNLRHPISLSPKRLLLEDDPITQLLKNRRLKQHILLSNNRVTLSEMSFPLPQKPRLGTVGIANLGNKCYANSAIQILRHSEDLGRLIQFDVLQNCQSQSTNIATLTHNSVIDSSAKVLVAFKDTFNMLWKHSAPAVLQPHGFWHTLRDILPGTIYEQFLENEPHDGSEFFLWLLDQLFMASQMERNDYKVITPAQTAEFAWADTFKNAWSPLADLLFGMTESITTCPTCNKSDHKYQTWNHLIIKPGTHSDENSLHDMLNRQMEDETLEGYKCDHCTKDLAKEEKDNWCKGHPCVKRSHRVWRLPQLLFVVIQRFDAMRQKNRSALKYDGSDISFDYMGGGGGAKEYKLFAVMDHHGNHLGGHYTAQAFNPVSVPGGEWTLYDDDTVHFMKGPFFGPTTYIVAFRQA